MRLRPHHKNSRDRQLKNTSSNTDSQRNVSASLTNFAAPAWTKDQPWCKSPKQSENPQPVQGQPKPIPSPDTTESWTPMIHAAKLQSNPKERQICNRDEQPQGNSRVHRSQTKSETSMRTKEVLDCHLGVESGSTVDMVARENRETTNQAEKNQTRMPRANLIPPPCHGKSKNPSIPSFCHQCCARLKSVSDTSQKIIAPSRTRFSPHHADLNFQIPNGTMSSEAEPSISTRSYRPWLSSVQKPKELNKSGHSNCDSVQLHQSKKLH
jgi:hypothetical protein